MTSGNGNPYYYGYSGGAGIVINGNYAYDNDFTFPAASSTVNVSGETINTQGENPTEQGRCGADIVVNGSYKNNSVVTNNPLGSVFVVGGQLNVNHVNYWTSTNIIDE